MLPVGWKGYILQDALEALIDYRGVSPNKSSKGIPLITAKIIKDGRINTPNEFIEECVYETWMRRGLPRYGDVVMTTEAPLGEVGQIRTHEKVALAQRVVTLRGRSGVIDNTFLKYFFLSPLGQKKLKARETGTTVTGIKQSELRQIEIYAPEYEEQISIADILTSLDDKIELNLQMNKSLEAIAQAIFKEWFIDFRFPGFDGELVDGLPKGWKIGTILEKAYLFSGGTPKTESKQFWNGDIKWISAKDITASNGGFILTTEKQISAEGLERSAAKLLPKYTTIVSARGTVGNYCIISEEMAISQSNYGLKAKAVNSDFYLFLVIKNMIEKMKAYSYGTVFDTITTKTFKEIEVIVPTLDKIVLFNNYLTPMFMRILFNSQQNQILTRLRDALLPKLMTGKIRVS